VQTAFNTIKGGEKMTCPKCGNKMIPTGNYEWVCQACESKATGFG